VIVEAPAKINLTLEVLRRRPDGYHDLRSLVMPVALTDRIELTFADQGVETVVTAEPGIDLSDLGAPEENLATRAARLLQAAGAPTPPAR
jgi:4-diphosphocytidyl-2-C-methyl-D-erythritol kinase